MSAEAPVFDPSGGCFVTFEGIDGSGKTTQAKRLARALQAEGRDVVATREPGGSPGGEDIRRLLVEGPTGRWSAETEMLLFVAARRDHVERIVAPALARGGTVICDRFADSTAVYQGAGRPDLTDLAEALHSRVIGLTPKLTFLIDTDPQAAAERTRARTAAAIAASEGAVAVARFEARGVAFQARVRAGFLSLAAAQPERVRVIPGDAPAETVAGLVLAAFREAGL